MKYLKRFNKISDYETFKGGEDYITPNIIYVEETEGLVFEPETKPVVQASNEIWYTSNDGNIVTPYKSNGFGANIVSKTYEDGKGVITFDGPIVRIPDSAFYNRRTLLSMVISDGVTSIDSSAFKNCNSLTSVTIPNGVTSIPTEVFESCYSLTDINIPDSVTYIGNNAFKYCSKLTSITIPNKVGTIGSMAFAYCNKLANVYCQRISPPNGGNDMFSSNASSRIIYVPRGMENTYKQTSYWSTYANYIVGYDF